VRAGHEPSVAAEGWTRGEFLRRLGGGAAVVLGSSWWRIGEAAGAGPLSTKVGAVQHFRSRRDLRPPAITVLHRAQDTSDGLLFLAPSSGPGQRGVLILDEAGKVVYFKPTTPNTAMNFRPALYRGKPVLTWWEGHAEAGLGVGTHVILAASYREIARFTAGGGRQSDLHEFVLTPHGTALVTSYETRYLDTRPWGGESAGKVIGGVVQELDLPSGRVLFEWRSLDHVGLDESYQSPGRNFFDYFHVNSIELDGEGDLIVSARNTWAVYKISRKTHEIVWRLGGKKSDFKMGKGTVFAWQHDARIHKGGRVISVFDDASFPQVEPQSRGLLIGLDYEQKTATLIQKFTHRPGRLISKFMGNVQVLDNDNVLVGWGGAPFVTEFAPDGSIVFDAKLPEGGQNYRAFRFPWVGRPARPPRAAIVSGQVYATWNGATEVSSWQLWSGRTAGSLTPVEAVPRRDFETVIDLPRGDRFAAVTALDAAGNPLGSSATVRA